jgi:hypothetical protein
MMTCRKQPSTWSVRSTRLFSKRKKWLRPLRER